MVHGILGRCLPAALLVIGVVVLGSADWASAQGKKSDLVVKVSASGSKIDPNGKQVITVTMKMDKGWHTYANPVGNEDLKSNETVVTVSGKQKLLDVKVDYPPGRLVKDKIAGDYKVYDDKVDIKVTVLRAKGDTGPLEVTAKIQACTEKTCYLPSTVKVTVP